MNIKCFRVEIDRNVDKNKGIMDICQHSISFVDSPELAGACRVLWQVMPYYLAKPSKS